MAFVSMQEVLSKKGRTRNRRSNSNYNLIAISKAVLKKPQKLVDGSAIDKKITIHITQLALQRSGFKHGDQVDIQFDYKNREGIILLSSGGKTISGSKKTKDTGVRTVQQPYLPGFGFPLAKNGMVPVPDGNIHISSARIIFNLRGMDDHFNYELAER